MNLINHGIAVRGSTVSIQFAVNGDATSHTCRIDRQQTSQCKLVNNWLCLLFKLQGGLDHGIHGLDFSNYGNIPTCMIASAPKPLGYSSSLYSYKSHRRQQLRC